MTRKIDKFQADMRGLELSSQEVALLTRKQREDRVTRLVDHSHYLLDRALSLARLSGTGLGPPRVVAGVLVLFSGGNDSTTLAHLFRSRSTHFAHANTTVGLEATRQFVRDISATWGVPLLERSSPKFWEDSYAVLVRERGFPGPGQHYKMYQRLKDHALYAISRELVADGRSERVVFVAGRRREESKRRADIPELERRDSIMWVSPMVAWTKLDLNTYRLMQGDVPVNEVTDILHMSGECLCGSFAQRGEFELLMEWFSSDPGLQVILQLEEELKDREDIPLTRRRWGWGPYEKNAVELFARSRMGALCGCAPRVLESLNDLPVDWASGVSDVGVMTAYELEYLDFRYPQDAQGKLNERSEDGWTIHTASIGYPYLHVLWEKKTGKARSTDEPNDLPQDKGETPRSPAARARQAEADRGDVVTEDKPRK